jgi:hypothetical protein
MPHEVQKMVYVGEMPWHGLGVRLPAAARYEEIVQAAGFYDVVERDVYVPPNPTPVPDRKGLVRGYTGEYLAVVGRGTRSCSSATSPARSYRRPATCGASSPPPARSARRHPRVAPRRATEPDQGEGRPVAHPQVRARERGARRRHLHPHQERRDTRRVQQHARGGDGRAGRRVVAHRPHRERGPRR